MLDLYFACLDCKIYIDCGCRWAYWELEDPKTVARNQPINIEAILRAEQYWNPPSESRWLYEDLFPPLRTFLQDHSNHEIVFCDKDYIAPEIDERYFEWMQVGYLASLSPRYFVDVLGFKDWEQVREYVEALRLRPSWWEITGADPSLHGIARRQFEKLVKRS